MRKKDEFVTAYWDAQNDSQNFTISGRVEVPSGLGTEAVIRIMTQHRASLIRLLEAVRPGYIRGHDAEDHQVS